MKTLYVDFGLSDKSIPMQAKPCPFCGHEEKLCLETYEDLRAGKTWRFVVCNNCGATGPSVKGEWYTTTEQDIDCIKYWNKRQ